MNQATQLPLFDTPSDWVAPSMADLPEWRGAKRVGVDIETCDPGLRKLGPAVRRGGFIAGVSFAIEDGPGFYLPMRHQGGGNLDPGTVLAYLRAQAKDYDGTIVGANINYDLDYLAEAEVNFTNIKWQRDVQVADPLINELHYKYSLQAISERWGIQGKDEALLRDACANYGLKTWDMWKLPARHVGPYAEWDARLPLHILRRQERVIDEKDLWQIYNLESELQPVLLKMRRWGVRIDLDALTRVEAWSLTEEQKALDRIYKATRVRINIDDIWKKDGVVAALKYIGVTLKSTPTGQPKVDKYVLDEIDHPVAAAILRARKVNKLRTTFAHSIRQHLVGDRIHCTFNQLRRSREDGDEVGAAYGRTSSEHPNLQQQPSRDDFADMWRSIYIPDHPEQEWGCLDYKQQEPRMLTHFAEVCGLKGAGGAADRYRNDPTTDNHSMLTTWVYPGAKKSDVDWKSRRNQCKDIYLGLCYNMGGAALAHGLGLPTKYITKRGGGSIEVAGDEAQALLNKFDKVAPYVRLLAKRCEAKAKKTGIVVTVLGRHCHFPTTPDGQFDWCHKALNRLIQGSSGDQTKKAMVECDKAGLTPQLQVHDELDRSMDNRKQAEQMAEIMCECVPLGLPSGVDIELGPSWGEAK